MRILFIEDNEDDALQARELLARVSGGDFSLEWVQSLSAALKKLETEKFDVVLTDLGLPDSSGLDTFRRLQAHASRLPIVILTETFANQPTAVEAIRSRAQEYLFKEGLDGKTLARALIFAVERKKLEKKLQEAMALKSEFTSMVSHELRTPLTVIKEGIGLVLDGSMGPVQPGQKQYLEAAQNSVDRLARLINDVLDYQKLEAGQIELHRANQDVNDIVLEALQGFLTQAEQKGLSFVPELAAGLPPISCDRDKIIQVLVNLINNALKFTDQGKIILRTERLDNAIRVSVRDEGIGIQAEDLPKLFQGFSQIPIQGARKVGGTGLGLAICKKIAEMHRGKIGVDSVYGKGSTFFFFLPVEERRSG